MPNLRPQRQGMPDLLAAIADVATGQAHGKTRRVQRLSPDLSKVVAELEAEVQAAFPGLPNARWVALRLLDGDERIAQAVARGELGELARPQAQRASELALEAR